MVEFSCIWIEMAMKEISYDLIHAFACYIMYCNKSNESAQPKTSWKYWLIYFLTGNKSEIQLFNFCAISVTHNVAVVIDNRLLGIAGRDQALTSSSRLRDQIDRHT